MGFMSPSDPPFDSIDEWRKLPYRERLKPLAQDWAINGIGVPQAVYLLYIVKLVIYAGGGLLLISATSDLGGLSKIGDWWTQPVVFQKAVVWTMLWEALGAARDLGRVHDIAAVLIRYGFGDLVQRLGMAQALERAGKVLDVHLNGPQDVARLEPAARVRRALEELGPTFVKLGQILATRGDLFPPEWIAEFGKLQDAAPAVPFADIRAQLTEDLGEAPEAVFAELDTAPLAWGPPAPLDPASPPTSPPPPWRPQRRLPPHRTSSCPPRGRAFRTSMGRLPRAHPVLWWRRTWRRTRSSSFAR